MHLGILFEKVEEPGFPPGYYYAHVPSLGLTTHGLGIEGARQAATELVKLWVAEKAANRERVTASSEMLFSTLDIPDHAFQGV